MLNGYPPEYAFYNFAMLLQQVTIKLNYTLTVICVLKLFRSKK